MKRMSTLKTNDKGFAGIVSEMATAKLICTCLEVPMK